MVRGEITLEGVSPYLNFFDRGRRLLHGEFHPDGRAAAGELAAYFPEAREFPPPPPPDWEEFKAKYLLFIEGRGAKIDIEEQRPITVTSVLYRLWAKARLGVTMEWQETWIATSQAGFRTAHGTDHVTWTLSVEMEEALMAPDKELWGFSLDLAKCFDRVPQELVFGLAEEWGMDARLLRGLRAAYAGMVSQFRLSQGVGESFKPNECCAEHHGVEGDTSEVRIDFCSAHRWTSCGDCVRRGAAMPRTVAHDTTCASRTDYPRARRVRGTRSRLWKRDRSVVAGSGITASAT